MPTYIVSCKKGSTQEQYEAARDHAIAQGGTIKHEYPLIKGFAVEFPADAVQTLESHENVEAVELDQEVRIQ